MCEGQCRGAVFPGYNRPASRSDGSEKGLELKLQRLLFAAPQLLDHDRRPHAGPRFATADHALSCVEVDREIIVTLKQPQTAHFVRRHAARRAIRHTSAV